MNTLSKRLRLPEKSSLELSDVRLMLDSALRELRDTIRRTGTLLDDTALYALGGGRQEERPRKKRD